MKNVILLILYFIIFLIGIVYIFNKTKILTLNKDIKQKNHEIKKNINKKIKKNINNNLFFTRIKCKGGQYSEIFQNENKNGINILKRRCVFKNICFKNNIFLIFLNENDIYSNIQYL